MKIGSLNFKDYAAKKPLFVSEKGEFFTASQIAKEPTLGMGSLFALSDELKMKLVLERYALEPDFKLGVIGLGLYTKDEVIHQIKDQTDLGKSLLEAELGYCNELIGDLAAPTMPEWPIVPDKPLTPIPDWYRRLRCIYLKLVNRALFCENTTDGVTSPFARYRIANVHPVFQARGFTNVVLQGANDIRANFIGPAKNLLTVYISGVGHGSYTYYKGNNDNHILEVGLYDAAEVNSKAIHLLSCQTARDLGPNTIANGAHCYAGYNENFRLVWDDGSTPAVNEFELFARSDSTFDIMMANGATAQAAFDATFQAFNAARALVPNTLAASLLTWDRDHLQLHGNPDTTIKSYRYVKICFPIGLMERENALMNAGTLME
jgi:hypothetical protein